MSPMTAIAVRAHALAAALLLVVGTAHASDRASTFPRNAAWQAECGSCHVPYPPRLLSANGWRQVMGTLDHHFGTDATLEPALAAEIGRFLQANAGADERFASVATPPRVTQTAWFVRKHDEVPAAVWKRPAIRSAANCTACHAGAEAGSFRERDIRIPR